MNITFIMKAPVEGYPIIQSKKKERKNNDRKDG